MLHGEAVRRHDIGKGLLQKRYLINRSPEYILFQNRNVLEPRQW